METITDLTEVVQNSFVAFGEKLMSVLPNILGALLLLIIGWLVAKVIEFIVKKVLRSIKFDRLGEKFMETTSIKSETMKVEPSSWVSKFVYWIILLLFIISASDTLGWNVVSESISSLVVYLPELFSAIIIFVFGLYLASFIKKFLNAAFDSLGLSAGNVLSSIVYYLLLIIVATTALDQAGIDTSLITANISIILGGIILAFAISFGFSSRQVLGNIVSSFYVRNSFDVGQKVKIGDISGEILNIDSLHVTISTVDGEILFPTQILISERIEKSTK